MGISHIAYDKKTKMHCVIRTIAPELLESTDADAPFAAAFNSLASAHNLLELLEAIDALPALMPVDASEDCAITANDALRKLTSGEWGSCRPENLADESCFEMQEAQSARSAKRATNLALKNRDAIEAGFMSELENASADSIVVSEPLTDWAYARNSLNLTAALMHAIQENPKGKCLEEARFVKRRAKSLKASVFIKPIAFNTYFSESGDVRASRLIEAAAQFRPPRKFGDPARWHIGGSSDVFIVTAPFATDVHRPPFEKKSDARDKKLYLCIEDSGGSQGKLAKRTIEAFGLSAKNLNVDDRDYGWSFDHETLWSEAPSPSYNRHSLYSNMMYQLIYHAGQDLHITKCQHCKKAILENKRGRQRAFCSPACRMQAVRTGGN